jgi:hypothetical protein
LGRKRNLVLWVATIIEHKREKQKGENLILGKTGRLMKNLARWVLCRPFDVTQSASPSSFIEKVGCQTVMELCLLDMPVKLPTPELPGRVGQ